MTRRAPALLPALALLLTSSAAQAYTTKETEGGKTVRWHQAPVAFRVDPALERLAGQRNPAELVRNAAKAWSTLPDAPGIVVKSDAPEQPGYAGGRPSNGVYVADPWPLAPNRLAVTVTAIESASGRILDTDILINPDQPLGMVQPNPGEPESDPPSDAAAGGRGQGKGDRGRSRTEQPGESSGEGAPYDLASVLTHEMGHVLGLDESMDAPRATMWPRTGRGETHQRTLEQDDVRGAQHLYSGTSLAPAAGCGGATVTGATGATARWLSLAGLCALLLLWRARVTRRPAAPARRVRRLGLGLATAVALGAASHVAGPASATPGRLAQGGELPLRTVSATAPSGELRLDTLLGDAERVLAGAVHREGVEERDGLLWTRYTVEGASGQQISFAVPGGRRDGIVQHVGQSRPPADGAQVVVAPREQGPAGWAYHQDGMLYGGWLGRGVALDLER